MASEGTVRETTEDHRQARHKSRSVALDRLLLIEEVADQLRTTRANLYQLRHLKRGPRSFRRGARVMYRQSAVDAYVAAEEAATGRGG